MRITTKGRYSLRALVHLTAENRDGPHSIRELSEQEGISPEFLEQLFFRLRKAGIIKSNRGPKGGFRLNRDPSKISAKEIFLAVGEEISLTPCTSEDMDLEKCVRSQSCTLEGVWTDASKHINTYFEGLTLQNIVDKYSIEN
jgi:Rrf2 family transcriptional regulator, iron-sulfur cluster assembly transcription factor